MKNMFGVLRSKGARVAAATTAAAGGMVASIQAHAIAMTPADLQTQIDTATANSEAALTMGQVALLGFGLLLFGFAAVYALLKKG